MEQNETAMKQTPQKFKSLTAGRILSCIPIGSILIFLLTLYLEGIFFNKSSNFTQIWNKLMLALGGIFIFISTIPSFVCSVIGLVLLIYARKKGARKTVPFIVLSAIGMITSVLISLILFSSLRSFESTVGQLHKLSKISAIEEVVLTYDSEAGGFHDGTMYNDFDLYLSNDRFLQVSHMSEYMTSFKLNGAGNWNLFLVYEDSEKKLIQRSRLEQNELSELCETKIKNLSDLISCYDRFIQKVEAFPLLEEQPAKAGFYKVPLQKEKLALREDAIYEDLLHQSGVVSVKKVKGHYDYLENYWYEIEMDDGHTFVMTVSAVVPKDDGNIHCDFFIRNFDSEPISILSMTNTTYGINYYGPYSNSDFGEKIGVKMHSYRDFFLHYKEFLELSNELLEKSKREKNDRNRNSNKGMMSGAYSLK